MKLNKLFSIRVIILIFFLVASVIAINPSFDTEGVDERREEPINQLENDLFINFLRDEQESKLKNNIKSNSYIKISKIFEEYSFEKNLETSLKTNQLDKILIKNINPIFLEENHINRRIDDFIIRNLPEIRPQPLPQVLPEVSSTRSFRSKTGFWADADIVKTAGITVKGESFDGRTMARIHFTPEGRGKAPQKVLPDGKTVPDYGKMSDSMIKGLAGISELIEAIDSGRFGQVEVLTGTTNINMALIAQRLGFRIVDQDRTLDGKIDKSKTFFTVMGRVENVREKLREYAESGRVERIKQRRQSPAAAAT